jgi:hypothetical protein
MPNHGFDTLHFSRAKFEALTLGTLAVVVAIALIGYALGRPVRECDLPLFAPRVADRAAG